MNRRDSLVGLFCAVVLSLCNALKLSFGGQPSRTPGLPEPQAEAKAMARVLITASDADRKLILARLNKTDLILAFHTCSHWHTLKYGKTAGAVDIPPEPLRTKPGDPGHGRHSEAQDLARALIALPRNNKHDILLQLSKTDPDILKLVTHYLQEYRVSLVVGVGAIRARVKLADLLKAANGDDSTRVDSEIWDFYEAEQQLLAETAPCMQQNRDEPDIYLLAYKGYCIEKGIPDSVRLLKQQAWATAMAEEPIAAARDEELNFNTAEGITIL